MAANDRQISGEHYKNKAIEPWDYVAANKLDYFQGSVIKYVTRFREKGGRRDLEKAIHFIDKLIEVEYGTLGGITIGKMIPCDDPQNITDEEIKDWISRLRQK